VYRQTVLWPGPHKTSQTPDIWQNLNPQEQKKLIAALAELISKAVYPEILNQTQEKSNDRQQ